MVQALADSCSINVWYFVLEPEAIA
jgi:hypothetical protein